MEEKEKKVLTRTVKQEIETKREVELPYYSKVSEFFYNKIYGEGECDVIKVFLGHKNEKAGIETGYINHALSLEAEQCTENEFEEAFQTAIKTLTELKNKV